MTIPWVRTQSLGDWLAVGLEKPAQATSLTRGGIMSWSEQVEFEAPLRHPGGVSYREWS